MSTTLDKKENLGEHIEGGVDIDNLEQLDNDAIQQRLNSQVAKRALLKIDLLVMPIIVLMYLFSSLDKSNLGNARTLGMMNDIGSDPTGSTYALLNSFYFIAYAPFMVPFTLLGKRRGVKVIIGLAGILWGTAATCFAAVNSYPGAFACRFFVGFGEAGFVPLVPFYLARMYTKRQLGARVAYWLAMAPMGGFFNGILAYGVSFIHSHLESWRVLFLIEGLCTIAAACVALIILPERIESARWLDDEEKEQREWGTELSMVDTDVSVIWIRSLEISAESYEINWKHARACLWRWQTILPALMYQSQQISGAALAAFMPTFTSENGFKGANAQIATLAPYGTAAVSMIALSYASDRTKNRGWFVDFGFVLMCAGFGIYLGVPATNRAARIVALIFAEAGHYISTPLILVWLASNCGNESRRAVAVPLANSVAQAVAVASGYLYPKTDAPVYKKGNAICMSLSLWGLGVTFLYQFLCARANRQRDQKEGGKPAPDHQPDTMTYADDARGFRYQL